MIQHIRLVNGEEIIGDVINVSDNSITVDNPLHVQEKVNNQGYTGIVLTKYIPFSQYKVCELQKQHIITTTELTPVIEKYYYLSLQINQNVEKNMLEEISHVNFQMEQMLYNNDDQSDYQGFIHKGSRSIN